MKKLKQIITTIKQTPFTKQEDLNEMIWQLICYSPKMPVRLQQQQLLDEAEKFTLDVNDEYFAKAALAFNGYKWQNGSKKILITHGWGSKAADFSELITALREIDDVEIIAFDAPGNGSSEGELSNLLLYITAIKAITLRYGQPDIFIGHSLGAMANIIAIKEMGITPGLLISIAPLIRLKENFEQSMSGVDLSPETQAMFLSSFEDKFGRTAAHFNLNDWYKFDVQFKHYLAYDHDDKISTYNYLTEFLDNNKFITAHEYENTGHERIIKSPLLIDDLANLIKANTQA